MGLPLSTLLSQALVAFTIEADHDFEVRMPHCTSESRRRGEPITGPWLISMPFWANCLQHVDPDGMTVGELTDRHLIAATFLKGSNPGLVRWGYLRLSSAGSRTKSLAPDWTVVPTDAGALAQRTWAPIPRQVEARWAERWPSITLLRTALEPVVAGADRDLPEHLPVNGGKDGRVRLGVRPPRPADADADVAADLGTLLARALLLFTLEVEASAPAALVHTANVLRVLEAGPVLQRDLPAAMGVAKETTSVMTGQVRREGLVAIGASKEVALTDAGRRAADETAALVAAVEARWPAELRAALEPLAGDGTVAGSALAEAIRPPEGTWRSRRPRPTTLPHHPVVSHRGGYPDGS